MADLGNLWFSLGLDDSKFEKQWNKALQKYKKQANVDMRLSIDKSQLKQLDEVEKKLTKFKKNFNGKVKGKIDIELTQNTINTLNTLKAMGGSVNQWKAIQQAAKAAGQLAQQQARANNITEKGNKQAVAGYKNQSLWLQNLNNLVAKYFSIYQIKDFITEIATVSGEFEKQRKTLQAMIGDIEGMDIYGKIKDLAVVSPFQFKELSSYAKQLASFSVPYEEIYDTTKRLADISAGVGVDMSRIILAYGQIKSAGVLKGTELRQLTEAGIPILDRLAEKFTQLEGRSVSIGEIFGKISQKMVSFEMVKDVFEDLTSEGGKFYNMQEIQAETLAGKISNLKDAYDIMLNDLGQKHNSMLNTGIESLYSLINNYERVIVVIKSLIAALTAYQFAQITAFSLDKIKNIASAAAVLVRFKGNIDEASKAMKRLNIAFSAPKMWGAILALIAGIATALISASREARRFKEELHEAIGAESANLENEIEALDALTNKIYGAAQGTEKRREAIEEYNKRFGQYLENLHEETAADEAIIASNERVVKSLQDRYKEEALLKARTKVDEKYSSDLKKEEAVFLKNVKAKGLNREGLYALGIVKDILKENSDATMTDIQKAFNEAFKDVGIANKIGTAFDEIFDKYKDTFLEYSEALKDVMKDVDDSFAVSSFKTFEVEKKFNEYTKAYERAKEKIKDSAKLTKQEVQTKLQEEEVKYLTKLTELYKDMPEHLAKYQKQLESLTKKEPTWRDTVKKILTDNMVSEGFAPRKDESYLNYIENLRKEYKELQQAIKDTEKSDPDNIRQSLLNRRAAYEAISAKYGFELDEKGAKKAEQEALKKQREEVDKLRNSYNNLLTLYKSYSKYMKEGLDNRVVVDVLKTGADEKLYKQLKNSLGTDGGPEEWFASMFENIITQAENAGEEVGAPFADSVRRALQNIDVKEDLDIFKIANDIKKELEKWSTEEFTLTGKGVALDISKILREQEIADNKAISRATEIERQIKKAKEGDAKALALLEIKYGKEVFTEKEKNNKSWLDRALKYADDLCVQEIKNNKKVAQEKIDDLAKVYGKDLLSGVVGEGFMQSLSDKATFQLREALANITSLNITEGSLKSLMTDEEYESFQQKLKLLGITLNNFINKTKEYIALQGKEISTEIYKNTREELLGVGKALLDIIKATKQLAKGDSSMSALIDGLGVAADLGVGLAKSMKMVEQKNKETGEVTKVLDVNWANIGATVATLLSNIISAVAASREYSRQMEIAEEKFATSVAQSRKELEISGEKFETIFGENIIAALEADSNAISDLVRDMRRASAEISKTKITTKKGFWGIGKQTITLKDLAPQLFKADGSVNGEYLDEFLDAYGDKLDDSQKALLETLKTNYEQYKDAMEDINSYLSDIFSDTASSIVDRMMEAFVQTGNAATELGDLVNSIAKGMAKDLIQSLLVDQYLEPAINRVKSLYNPSNVAYEEDAVVRTQKAILAVQDAMQAAQAAVPEVNRILEAIQNMGIDLSGDTEKATDVLSGLTEEQQNLLMGYINGIRADVSYNKGLLSNIVASVGTINNNIATAIIVWKQIEANTHRSADGVDRIIGFFESVMGPYDGGGGQAFQVNIA